MADIFNSSEPSTARQAMAVGGAAHVLGCSEGSPPTLPSRPSIAVMPFANLGGDPAQEYFADGMTDEIASALTRFKSLFVIANGATQTFKGMTVMPLPQEVARQFAVRYVLEGDVRQDANRVRISVKLRSGADGAQIWGERVEDTLENVFALQDKVALGVAWAIEPGGRAPEIRRVPGRPTNDVGSYDRYLRARALQRKMTRPDVSSALDLAEQAIALDPGFALATALAATCHSVLDRYNWAEDRETHRRQSHALAHRALQLAPDDPEIPALVAYCLGAAEADLAGAIALIDCATTLKPRSALGWRMSGNVRARNGEPDTAVEHLQRSIRLNPSSADGAALSAGMGMARFQHGRIAEAAALFEEAAARQSESHIFNALLAASYGHLGRESEARRALARCHQISPTPIDEAAAWIRGPAYRKLFLDGIALAKEKARTAD